MPLLKKSIHEDADQAQGDPSSVHRTRSQMPPDPGSQVLHEAILPLDLVEGIGLPNVLNVHQATRKSR